MIITLLGWVGVALALSGYALLGRFGRRFYDWCNIVSFPLVIAPTVTHRVWSNVAISVTYFGIAVISRIKSE